ncbi:MAG: hypothetical protein IKA87_06890 [Lentisphaeria bacterium]|nr:hypothetical protein [Lentisphaeria bacterium]
MNIDPQLKQATEALRLSYPNYTLESYQFVSDAVAYTVGKLAAHRHVSAAELLAGTKEYAYIQYGAVAAQVMNHFGLAGGRNVGEVVYLLISVNLLSASPEDSPEDFNIDFSWQQSSSLCDTSNIKLPFIDAD